MTGEFPAQRDSNTAMFPFDDVIMELVIKGHNRMWNKNESTRMQKQKKNKTSVKLSKQSSSHVRRSETCIPLCSISVELKLCLENLVENICWYIVYFISVFVIGLLRPNTDR